MKGHRLWQLNEENSCSSLKQPQREVRHWPGTCWALGLYFHIHIFLSFTYCSCRVAGPLCPYKISALSSDCSLLCNELLQQPKSLVYAKWQQLWRHLGQSFALADHRVYGSTHDHRNKFYVCVHSFSSSDSFHMLTLGPSPTAQIRIMGLGAETYTFSSCYYVWCCRSRHTWASFFKELLQFPLAASKFMATHSVWKYGIFMPFTRYLKSTQSAQSLGQIPYLINPNSGAVTFVAPLTMLVRWGKCFSCSRSTRTEKIWI